MNINTAAKDAIISAVRQIVIVDAAYYYQVHERASVERSPRFPNLWSVMVHEHGSEYKLLGDADPWINSVFEKTFIQEQHNQATGKTRTRTITRGVKYTTSISAAYSYIAGGIYPDSHVISVGNKLTKNIATKLYVEDGNDWGDWS